MTKYNRSLLADKPGLGKTATAILSAHLRGSLHGKVLIPCSKSALSVWRNEISLWVPQLAERLFIVEGTRAKRKKVWDQTKGLKGPQIFCSTYGSILQDEEDIPRHWDLMMPDEAHKALRNHKTQIYDIMDQFVTEDLYQITGSPASKGVQHMYGYLHMQDNEKFGSYWKFLNRYCEFDNGPFGREFLGNQNMDELKELLSTRMIRRMKSGDMPQKHRRKLWVEMTNEELTAYKQIDETGILPKADGSYLLSPIQAVNQLRCRQLFTCPKLLDPNMGYGSGIQAICQHVDDLELKHTVIYSAFPAAFKYFKEYIQKTLKVPVYMLVGGTDSKVVQRTIDTWKAEGGIILCSIRFATSFNLTKASIGYILGFEWDPEDNYQAEDRQHRLGIKEDVSIYYAIHDNALTHRQLEILDDKVTQVGRIYPLR